jgi:hypothetical protein
MDTQASCNAHRVIVEPLDTRTPAPLRLLSLVGAELDDVGG